MKKVKNKIIALMLVIPLLLMFSLSTAAKTVEILVDVPVSSIELTVDGKKEKEVDVCQTASVALTTKIEPSSATHQTVIYQTQAVEGKKQAEVEISADGVVTPKSLGSVSIIAVAGGKKDSVTLVFSADKVAEVNQNVNEITLKQGENRKLSTGVEYSLYPSSANYEIDFVSSNTDVATVTAQGEIKAKFVGESDITVNVKGIAYMPSSKSFEDYTHTLTFKVKVSQKDTDNSIVFDSGENNVSISSFSEKVTNVDMSIDKTFNVDDLRFFFDESVIEKVTISKKDGDSELYQINIEWKSTVPVGTYEIVLTDVYQNKLGAIGLERGKVDWKINYDGDCYLAVGGFKDIDVTVNGAEDYRITYTSSDAKTVGVVKRNDTLFRVNGQKEGSATVTANLIIDDEIYDTLTLKVWVRSPYKSISIQNNDLTSSLTNSLARELTFGGYRYRNGSLASYTFDIPINVSSTVGVIDDNVDLSKLVWRTSNDRIATVVDGAVTFSAVDDGDVTLTVESAYNEELGFDVKASLTIRVVQNAVNIFNYDELILSQKQGKQIVLQDDIMLAPLLKTNLDDSNWRNGGYKDYIEGKGSYDQAVYGEFEPTTDIAYYRALGKQDSAKLKYFVEFTASVYGNGHYIDADYLTRGGEIMYKGEKSSGGFIFQGPLSLVKISYATPASATDNASIKSQDNAVFLVRNDNVSLRNVELKGCSDNSVNGDLSNLDYCGTVLEVSGDNFDMSYCKVNNGRTVVRIYGKAYQSDESELLANLDKYKTHSNIQNCILTYGREFILKIGTNQLKRGENIADPQVFLSGKQWWPNGNVADYKKYYDQANPYLTKADGSAYSTVENKDDYFIQNYVLNDVTLENSVFIGAGLFAIGMDSQFGGLVLDGWNYSDNYRFGSDKGWGDVAGTSYPARLSFVGDVRIYDWKKISAVNSDTLLEAGDLIKEKLQLNLNISTLIDDFRKNGNNEEIVKKFVLTSGGESYINSGVAFYGGGKNYDILDLSGVNDSFSNMFGLTIDVKYFSLSYPAFIYYSAGIEPFRFMVYQADSSDENYLSYDKQRKDLADNQAYTWVYRS